MKTRALIVQNSACRSSCIYINLSRIHCNKLLAHESLGIRVRRGIIRHMLQPDTRVDGKRGQSRNRDGHVEDLDRTTEAEQKRLVCKNGCSEYDLRDRVDLAD